MHTLALKGETSLAQLWFIDTTKYAGLLLSQYGNWTIKIIFSKADYKELKKKPI